MNKSPLEHSGTFGRSNALIQSLGVLAVITQLLSILTSDWSVLSTPGSGDTVKMVISMGLWKKCNSITNSCVSLPPSGDNKFPKNSLMAVRALTIMGMVAVLVGVICDYMPNCEKHRALAFAIGGLLSVVGSIVWLAEFTNIGGTKYQPGYSFYLNLIGGLSALGAGAYLHYG